MFQIYFYMTSPEYSDSKFPPTMIPATMFENPSLAYIDLDLSNSKTASGQPPSSKNEVICSKPIAKQVNKKPVVTEIAVSDEASTAYKEIDVLKTQALLSTLARQSQGKLK